MSEVMNQITGGSTAPHAKRGLIEIKDFNLDYETLDGSVEAVTGVDIRVEPGEFVSVIGQIGRAHV